MVVTLLLTLVLLLVDILIICIHFHRGRPQIRLKYRIEGAHGADRVCSL